MDESKGDNAPLLASDAQAGAGGGAGGGGKTSNGGLCGCCGPDDTSFEEVASPAQLALITELRQEYAAPFQPGVDSMRLLGELCKELLPDADPSQPLGPHWKRIGFQGTNPATDIRGAGMFGLESLVKLTKEYPYFHDLFLRSDAAYPFAASALNVTRMLVCHLGLSLKPPRFCSCCGAQIGEATRSHALIDGVLGLLEGNRNAFFAIYTAALVILDATWRRRSKDASFTLLQFNEVLVATRKAIVYLLEQQPYSTRELLQQACKHAHVSYALVTTAR